MRPLFRFLALTALAACAEPPGDDAGSDTDGNTDGDTDVQAEGDTDATADTDEAPPEVGFVRFQGFRDPWRAESLTSVTARLDGEPISAGFDAGVRDSSTGWFYPGSDAVVELAVGEHEVTIEATSSESPCPDCPAQPVQGTKTLTLDIEAGAELYVNFYVGGVSRGQLPVDVWSVDDTRERVGGAGVRLVGGSVPMQPRFVEEVTLATATGGCVSRAETVVSPLWGTVQTLGVPQDDDAEAWIGIEYTNPLGPSSMGWYELPTRPAGEVLQVFTLPMRVAPATEGAGVEIPAGTMIWPLCPAGPS